jgi:glycoside/pentoside/hexuronide:cation symporter, GPH family
MNMNRWKRFFFGAGGFAENTLQNAPSALVNPIYNVGLGVSPVLIGIALAVPRFWEILLDPWIGSRSDGEDSHWGRRKPYLIPGAVLSAFLFILIWWVPNTWSHEAQGAWLILCSFLFFTAYSFFAIPYAALAIEVTQDTKERMRIMAVRNAWATFSNLPIHWLYWLCQRSIFSSPLEGMRYLGIIFGILIGVAALLPAFMYKETPYVRPKIEPIASEKKLLNTGVFKPILLLRSFQWLLFSILTLVTGFTLVAHLGFYLTVYYSCRGDKDLAAWIMGINGTLGTVLTVFFCPVISALANRIGKHNALIFFLAIGCLGSLSTWWSITPAMPYLGILSSIPICFGIAAYWTIAPALLGDISDSFSRKTGLNYQGTFSAIYGIAIKIGVSLSLMVTGYVLVFCHFDAQLSSTAMAEPLHRMRILFALVPCGGMLMAILAIRKLRGEKFLGTCSH